MQEEREESHKQWHKLLNEFSKWQTDIEKRKQRGENDFNPLLCIEEEHKEVKMHSRFLYALLNPYGEHYQDELFLELFLEFINLKHFFDSYERVEVKKEYKHIDILITDGQKSIIIENKIKALDGKKQIARYLESVAKELNGSEDSTENIESWVYENVAVVYLALYDKEPSKESLSEWKIVSEKKDKYLTSSKGKVQYRQISYDKEILDWLNECERVISNITNLKVSVESYKNVVKKITGKETTMDTTAFFRKNKNLRNTALELAAQQVSIINAVFDDIETNITQEYGTQFIFERQEDCLNIFHTKDKEYKMRFAIVAYINLSEKKYCGDFYLELKGRKKNIKDENFLKILEEAIGLQQDKDFYTRRQSLHIYGRYADCEPEDLEAFFEVEDFMEYFKDTSDKLNELNEKIKANYSKLEKFIME